MTLKTNLIRYSLVLAPIFIFGGCVSSTAIKSVQVQQAIDVPVLKEKKKIQFKKVVVKVKRGTEVGTIHGGWLNVPQEKYYWRRGGYFSFDDSDLDTVFREELESSGYRRCWQSRCTFRRPWQLGI